MDDDTIDFVFKSSGSLDSCEGVGSTREDCPQCEYALHRVIVVII